MLDKNSWSLAGMIRIVLTVMLFVSVPFSMQAHEGASGIVKQRMDRFKASRKQLKAIVTSAKENNFIEIEKQADLLVQWAAEMVTYFPEGSDGGVSEAAPSIWTDFEGFKVKAADFSERSEQLLDAARQASLPAVMKSVEQLGQSCKSCHQTFRLK